jgi:flavin reductase (DIM6/NTAB) family NADH-FMN oxidoreductase RutF
MSTLLRKILLGGDAATATAWVCVGHAEPEAEAEVLLHGLEGGPVEVTRCHAMVALRPFTIAIGFPGREGEGEGEFEGAGDVPAAPGRARRPRPLRLALAVRERRSGDLLGEVRLRPWPPWPWVRSRPDGGPAPGVAPAGLRLFVSTGCSNRCLPAPRLRLHYLDQRWRLWRDRNPRNSQKMAAGDLFSKWVLFCQPRPVVVVSYAAAGGSNLFPMDLVGPAGGDRFLLGLHQPSPAIAPILESGRLAVSTVPLALRPLVFGLGRNHRHAAVDPGALPFALARSASWGLPVPRQALTVRELEVTATVSLGSHLLLVTRQVHCERRGQGLQMCHTHGFYQRYLERRGRALPSWDGRERPAP